MRARAPASSANLGPGFDALALALDLHVTVEVTEADELTVTADGHGADLPADAEHLAARVATAVAGHDRLAIHVVSEIPVGRGLGSSAALAVATAAAAGASDILERGAAADGHPENAAASTLGGLVTAATIDGHAVARRLTLDPALRFVLMVPDRQLRTSVARDVLPPTVTRADAVFNIGRLGLLVAGLADHRLLLAHAAEDRLHQADRGSLFPEAAPIIAGLVAAGALAACWSGAGPSLLGFCTEGDVGRITEAGRGLLATHGVPGAVLCLAPDLDGVTVEDGPGR
ncbi:MAG: homoserine kinase [Actinomycetota bacterium]|nr:homoserine kinase [Actinomycetota bacterium]